MKHKDGIFQLFPRELRTVVEVGTYRGDWTARLLAAVPGDYVVYAIDPWGCEGYDAMRVGDEDHALFEERFAGWIKLGRVVPMRLTSAQAAAQFTAPIDVLFLDGDHRNIEDDLRLWVPHCRDGALVVGHDFSGHWQSHHVQAALVRYFHGQVCWTSGAVVGNSEAQAQRIHSFYFHKRGDLGMQDAAAL